LERIYFLDKLLDKTFQVLIRYAMGISMTETRLLLSLVDDDESVRESLPDLLREMGFTARAFSSAEEFLESDTVLRSGCLILDLAMPGMTGPELQRELKRRQIQTPIIFITGNQDSAVRKSTIDQGAVECLLKPFTDTALMNALNAALRVK
jgi:FixJ family two-component response regulator